MIRQSTYGLQKPGSSCITVQLQRRSAQLSEQTATAQNIAQLRCVLQVASGCFTPDSQHAIIGDKFGDVSVMPAQRSHTELMPLLGHYCATITALAVDASGRYLSL